MRIHKYRAWDTKRNRMWSAEELGRDELTLNPDGRGFVNVSGISPRLSQHYPHLIPLEYLHRRDKEGTEIYEGDIIGIRLTAGICRAVIEWDQENACFGCRWDKDTARVRKEVSMPRLPENLTSSGNPWEVLGSIYQHPELLN